MTLALNKITAKWAGTCAGSGRAFATGATVLHDPVRRRCYLPGHEPAGALVTETVAGSRSAAYREGWAAGAPDAPMTTCPHLDGTPEARMWTEGLRDRHRSGT